MIKSNLDVTSIAEFAAVVKAQFEAQGIKAVFNISLSELLKLKRKLEDPDAAKHEVEKQTRKAIEEVRAKLEMARSREMKKMQEGKEYKNLDENLFSSEILMPYRTALEMEIVPEGTWTREEFNREFGLNINEKNWGRWVMGHDDKAYTSQQTKLLEKAYAQFVIGF